MKNNSLKINKKLEKLKDELDQAMENPNSTIEEITEISHNIDNEIIELYLK